MKPHVVIITATSLFFAAQAASAQVNASFGELIGGGIAQASCVTSSAQSCCATGCATCMDHGTQFTNVQCECVPKVRRLYPIPCLDACGCDPCGGSIFGEVLCDMKDAFGGMQACKQTGIGSGVGLLHRLRTSSVNSCSIASEDACTQQLGVSSTEQTITTNAGCSREIGLPCTDRMVVDADCGCESALSCTSSLGGSGLLRGGLLSGGLLGNALPSRDGCSSTDTCFQDFVQPSPGCRPRGLLAVLGDILFSNTCSESCVDSCSSCSEPSCDGIWTTSGCSDGGCRQGTRGVGWVQGQAIRDSHSGFHDIRPQNESRQADRPLRPQTQPMSRAKNTEGPFRSKLLARQLRTAHDRTHEPIGEVQPVRYDAPVKVQSLRFRD